MRVEVVYHSGHREQFVCRDVDWSAHLRLLGVTYMRPIDSATDIPHKRDEVSVHTTSMRRWEKISDSDETELEQ